MSPIDQMYSDAPYEVRIKARLFQRVLAILIGVFALFCGIFIVYGLFSWALLGFGIATVALIVSWWLLRRGHYDRASLLVGPAALGALYITNLTLDFGAHTFASSAGAYAALSLVSTLFVRNRKYGTVLGVVLMAAFFLQIGLQWGAMEASKLNFLSVGLGSVVFLSITLVLGVILQSVFVQVSEDQLTQLGIVGAARKATQDLVAQVAVQLDKSDRLTQSAEETTAAGFEIERNVHSIKDQISTLDQRFRNAEGALENISQNLAQLASLAGKQSDSVSHSGSAVEQMVASIQSVSKIIDARSVEVEALKVTAQGGQKAIAQTGEAFKVVVAQIESIKEMTKLITGIAAQTNLLAMNAAIEAAHAGEAGAGFSVVAAEIRKLAESSRQSAGTIAASLKDLTKAIGQTDQSVRASGSAFEEVQENVERVAGAMVEIGASTHEMNTGTEEILRSTTDLQGATRGVESSVTQVAEAYRLILSEVKQISRIITEVTSGMDEIGTGATDIREAVAALTGLSADLKEQIARLKDAGN